MLVLKLAPVWELTLLLWPGFFLMITIPMLYAIYEDHQRKRERDAELEKLRKEIIAGIKDGSISPDPKHPEAKE